MGGSLRLHIAGWWLLVAGTALAQPEPGAPPSQEPEAPRREYAGPAILSRGLGAFMNPDRELLRLRPFASVNGIYDTGLTAISVNETGQLLSRDAYGAEADFGVTGYRAWQQSLLGLQYHGRLRHYSRYSYYDGFDNFFGLNLVHRPSRRVTVQISPAVASYSRGYFVPDVGSAYYSPELTALTQGELFDSRVNAVIGSGRLIYQRTTRLSFSLGGNGFSTRRHSQLLAGVTGYSAVGDLAYRLSRYQSIGVDYSFTHYDFQRVFGDTDAHGIGLNYSVQIGRDWTLALRAGGHRVEISRLQSVPLDPVIAAIVGQGVAVSTTYLQVYQPTFGGRLARRYRRGAVDFEYTRSISPGNGLYLTSAVERGGLGASYRGTRRASFYVHASALQYRSLVQNLGRYRSLWGDVGMNYTLGRALALSLSVGARQYEVRNTQLDRVSFRASVGLTYSPGELPFSLW